MNEFKVFRGLNLMIRIDRIDQTMKRIHLKVEMIDQNHSHFHQNKTIAWAMSNYSLSLALLPSMLQSKN